MELAVSILILVVLLAILERLFCLARKPAKTVYMGAAQQFDASKDVTTVLPLPLHAATCNHHWEVLAEHTLETDHEKKYVVILQCRDCGSIDKTVQVTSPQPAPPPEPPCKHEWHVTAEQTLEMPHEKQYIVILTCQKCGEVDKTHKVTTEMPKMPSPKSECRHRWETEKRVVLESAYEQMLKSISHTQGYNSKPKIDPNKRLDLDLDKAPAWMFQKAHISVRYCTQCGEIDKTIAYNFEAEPGEDEGPVQEETLKLKKAP